MAAIIYTDISRDGLLKGLNLDATIALADEVNIPVVASGGLASIADVKALLEPRAKQARRRDRRPRALRRAARPGGGASPHALGANRGVGATLPAQSLVARIAASAGLP